MATDNRATAGDGAKRLLAGRYLTERELGRGATAIVYLAQDRETGRQVAVKMLRDEFAESIGANSFLKEIRNTATLSHPQIVPVLDSGREGGLPFFVLPYFPGGTLRQKLEREKQLQIAEALTIATTVAAALHHAHSRNLLHRDVKPENILFDEAGVAHLADFGISRALIAAADDTVTSASIIRGTIPYMSPEQVSGDANLDGRSDVYSLACVLYEMIGGVQPFIGPSSQSVMSQRLTRLPQPVVVFRPSAPMELGHALEKAFAIAPTDRYQTASDFANALAHVADLVTTGHGSYGADVPQAESAQSAKRRWMLRVMSVGAVAAAIATWALWPGARQPAATRSRVAVLSFQANTPDSGLALIGRALARDVIGALGRAPDFPVLASAAMRNVPPDAPLDSLRKALQVGTFVTGTLEQRGDSIRVDVQVINAETMVDESRRPIHAQVPRALLMELRDTVVERVARELLAQFGLDARTRRWRGATRSAQAWQLRQRAEDAANHARSLPRQPGNAAQLAAFVTADSLLRAASAADPAWTEPYIARGWIRHERTSYVGSAREAAELAAADSLANVALSRRAGDARALELRGTIRLMRWINVPGSPLALRDSAEADLHAALRVDDELTRAWWALSLLRDVQGDNAGATDAARRAQDADAYLLELNRTTMRLVFNDARNRRADSALARCSRARALFPGDPIVRTCHLTLLGWFGRGERDVRTALDELAWTERAWPRPASAVTGIDLDGRFLVAALLARSGLRDSARRVAASTRARLVGAGIEPATFRVREAFVLAELGEHVPALALLEASLTADPGALRYIDHPWFDPLRREPRFQQMLKTAGR